MRPETSEMIYKANTSYYISTYSYCLQILLNIVDLNSYGKQFCINYIINNFTIKSLIILIIFDNMLFACKKNDF